MVCRQHFEEFPCIRVHYLWFLFHEHIDYSMRRWLPENGNACQYITNYMCVCSVHSTHQVHHGQKILKFIISYFFSALLWMNNNEIVDCVQIVSESTLHVAIIYCVRLLKWKEKKMKKESGRAIVHVECHKHHLASVYLFFLSPVARETINAHF